MLECMSRQAETAGGETAGGETAGGHLLVAKPRVHDRHDAIDHSGGA